jgi:hypothetical protein
MATQNTKATRTTIKVYSTKPWPSSSTQRRFKSSIVTSPPFQIGKFVCRENETKVASRKRYADCFKRQIEQFMRVVVPIFSCRAAKSATAI